MLKPDSNESVSEGIWRVGAWGVGELVAKSMAGV